MTPKMNVEISESLHGYRCEVSLPTGHKIGPANWSICCDALGKTAKEAYQRAYGRARYAINQYRANGWI